MNKRKKSVGVGDVLAVILGSLFLVAIIAIPILIRLWIVQGDMTCFFATDVGVCMAVKGL